MEMAETPGVLVTVTPWRAAAARSTLSVPVPHSGEQPQTRAGIEDARR